MSDIDTTRILLVDDEQAVLDGLCRQHRKQFSLVPACGPEAALTAIDADGPFAAVVSDYQMPRMNGAELLAKAREKRPDMARIMLTGQADLRTAIDAVNRGNIFRFLTKPCDPELFRKVLHDGIEQYRLKNAERLLLEHTLKGSIEVLADVLALASPAAFGRATRIRDHVRQVVRHLDLPDGWQYETAALLSQVGCVAIPDDIFDRLSKGESLDRDQISMLDRHPQVARELLAKIPRLQRVAEMVGHQGAERGELVDLDRDVVLGSCILAAAVAYEELLSLGAQPAQAIAALRNDPRRFELRILEALAKGEGREARSRVSLLPMSRLQPGMVLEEEIRDRPNDALIVTRGHVLTVTSLERLRSYADLGLLKKTDFRVRADPSSAGGARPSAA